jgi:hypothetical protein
MWLDKSTACCDGGRLGVGVEIKLETHELNEYSKTRLHSAQIRTLMSQAKLAFLAH